MSAQVLESSEDTYERGVRTEHMTFFTLDNILARFAVKITKINAWIVAQNDVFSSGRHGNSRTEVETLLDAFSAYEEQARQYAAAVDVLESWAGAEGMERHEEQVNCYAHVAHARQSLAALGEAAAAYHAALLVSKEKHAHLAVCAKVTQTRPVVHE
jgi:hypothetical protein